MVASGTASTATASATTGAATDQTLGEFAYRFTGSSDLYANTGRRPSASINFVTAHDGFTLRDLVSYNDKHNEANGEDNRDGESHNRSWNCGAEGPTDDPRIVGLRARQQRNFLATLFLSQGVPMLLGGDEMGRTQGGNNNAYCQDNEISWFDWEQPGRRPARVHRAADRACGASTRCSAAAAGSRAGRSTARGCATSAGSARRRADERRGLAGTARQVARRVPQRRRHRRASTSAASRSRDDSFYVLFNAHHETLPYRLPARPQWGESWRKVLDTDAPFPEKGEELYAAGGEVPLAGRSVVVLVRETGK